MPYDPLAYNQLIEISMRTSDVRYLQAKSNCVADMLSRPGNVPIGTAYALPSPDEDAPVDVVAVTRQQARQSKESHNKKTTVARRAATDGQRLQMHGKAR